MNFVVKHHKALYELDHHSDGFRWVDANNSEFSVFSFLRYAKDRETFVLVILNMTPIVHHHFRVGVPKKGTYKEIINSDQGVYGGSDLYNGEDKNSEDIPMHGFKQSIEVVLSPLGMTILECGD